MNGGGAEPEVDGDMGLLFGLYIPGVDESGVGGP
jgi:hypothetical protein